MQQFRHYLLKNDVKKQNPNVSLARALFNSAIDRKQFLNTIKITDFNSRFIVENIYDVIRELIESKLAIDGYKSYSHEATIAYLKELSVFSDREIEYIDELRKIRNGIKYSGKELDELAAKNTLKLLGELLPKLIKLTK